MPKMRWKINTHSVFPYLSIIHDIIYIPFHSIPYELKPCGDYLTSLFLTHKNLHSISLVSIALMIMTYYVSKIDVTIAIILHERQIFLCQLFGFPFLQSQRFIKINIHFKFIWKFIKAWLCYWILFNNFNLKRYWSTLVILLFCESIAIYQQ